MSICSVTQFAHINIIFSVLLLFFFSSQLIKWTQHFHFWIVFFPHLQTYLQNNRFHFFLLNIFTSHYHFYSCVFKCLSSAESQQTLQRNSCIHFTENTSECTAPKASITAGTETTLLPHVLSMAVSLWWKLWCPCLQLSYSFEKCNLRSPLHCSAPKNSPPSHILSFKSMTSN